MSKENYLVLELFETNQCHFFKTLIDDLISLVDILQFLLTFLCTGICTPIGLLGKSFQMYLLEFTQMRFIDYESLYDGGQVVLSW